MSVYTTVGVVYGRTFMNTVLSVFKTASVPALIVAGKVRLSKDPAFSPTPDSTIASFTGQEATFTGYPAGGIAVSLTTNLFLTAGALGDLTTALYVDTGPAIGNTIWGYWIDDGVNVIAAERFAGGFSVPMSLAGDFLDLTVILPMQLTQQAS